MKVTCIKNYTYVGITYFTKGKVYETNQKRKRNYTVSSPDTGSKRVKFITIASHVEDVNYRFSKSKFDEYFTVSEIIFEGNTLEDSNEIVIKEEKIEAPKYIPMALKDKNEKFNVTDTFLALTSYTYPHGNEHRLRYFLPEGVTRDRHGNYIYQIGNSRTIFACHLDTANNEYGPVVHVFDGNFIKTNGKTILGADDKAGVTVLLYLIHNRIPGTYYFFVGEECGCIGSKAAAKSGNFENYDRIISFDRRNTCSIITYQQGARCCSQDFANALSEQYRELGLNLNPDDTGLVTDSAQFTGLISECTNISVGYYSEHTHNERQDINFLTRLCEASVQIAWEALPAVRNTKVVERKQYTNNGNNYFSNNKRRENYSHHGKNGRFRNFQDLSQGNLFGQHSYNQHENPFDEAFEEDYRKKNKGKKGKGKKNDRHHDLIKDGVDENILADLIRPRNKERDPYITYKELLLQAAFPGDNTLLTAEQYSIVDENMVN